MLQTIKRLWGKLFKDTEPIPETPEPSKPLIPHEWPFPHPKPTNTDYLIGQLIENVKVEGNHVYYVWNGERKRHIRDPQGRETALARNIVWWIEGRKVPPTSAGTGLSTNCGEPRCIKISHLTLRVYKKQHGPQNKPKSYTKHQAAKGKALAPKPKKKYTAEDRLHCDTRKIYFPTQSAGERAAREANKKENRKNGPRQYNYPCDQCDGYHLSHIKPSKFRGDRKKVGTW